VATQAALVLRLELDSDGRLFASIRLIDDLGADEPQLVQRVVGRDALVEFIDSVILGLGVRPA
jgi:hypothetical protein